MAIIPIRQNLLCFELGLRPDLTGGGNESSRVAFHFSQGTSNSFAESITAADFGEFLSERQSLLDAIENRRRDRDIAFAGQPVAHRADVVIDTKDLLDHHDGRFRRTGGIGAIAAQFETVRSRQFDILSHGSSICV